MSAPSFFEVGIRGRDFFCKKSPSPEMSFYLRSMARKM